MARPECPPGCLRGLVVFRQVVQRVEEAADLASVAGGTLRLLSTCQWRGQGPELLAVYGEPRSGMRQLRDHRPQVRGQSRGFL